MPLETTTMHHPFRREVLQLGVQHAIVIFIGLMIFLLDKFEGFGDRTNYLILMSLAMAKSVYTSI